MKNRIIRKRLSKNQIFTIPNLMSFFRLLLIPAIFCLYRAQLFVWSFALIVVSSATDVLDGIIARRFGMITDLGKFLDPLADKLTQLTILICLATKHSWLYIVVGIFILKEIAVTAVGALVLRRTDRMPYARWYGKAATVLFDSGIALAVLVPDLGESAIAIIFGVCLLFMAFSAGGYISDFSGKIKQSGRNKPGE